MHMDVRVSREGRMPGAITAILRMTHRQRLTHRGMIRSHSGLARCCGSGFLPRFFARISS